METRFITPDEAISLLNDGEQVHTFRNPSGMLIGADHRMDSLIEKLKMHPDKIQLGGDACRQMKHGLILEDESGYLFIETNEAKLNSFDPLLESGYAVKEEQR